MSDDVKLTVLIDGHLDEELRKHCAATGLNRSSAVRELLSNALLERNASAHAGILRRMMREEFGRWLEYSRIQKEFAADDYYDRLSAALATDMAELRRIAGGNMYLGSTILSMMSSPEVAYTVVDDNGEAHAPSRDDWYSTAIRVGLDIGIGESIDATMGLYEELRSAEGDASDELI